MSAAEPARCEPWHSSVRHDCDRKPPHKGSCHCPCGVYRTPADRPSQAIVSDPSGTTAAWTSTA